MIELNPVRARAVRHPRDWRGSSYRAHAYGDADPLAHDHELYDMPCYTHVRNAADQRIPAETSSWPTRAHGDTKGQYAVRRRRAI